MSSMVQDDYVVYDFSDDDRVNSSDEDEAAATAQILANGPREERDLILAGRSVAECREWREQAWEDAMEHALDQLPDLTAETQLANARQDKSPGKSGVSLEAAAPKRSDCDENGDGGAEDEDPLYDENADDEDEAWVKDQISSHYPKPRDGGGKQQQTSSSDAVLSCPACLSVLCMDCQRHDLYANQFRAMFVLNCRVVLDELLHLSQKQPPPPSGKKSKRKKRKPNSAHAPTNELFRHDSKSTHVPEGAGAACPLTENDFHPVRCDVCSTEVAVLDKDEVYHFYNAIASLP